MDINRNLAYRMRPHTLSDLVGQQHLLGEGKFINNMVKAKRLCSMILYGPPGVGKTSIAQVLSNELEIPFAYFNASIDDKKKLQAIIKEQQDSGKQAIVMIDELHRLDKTKQDFFLPYLESGDIIMVGATTDNPYCSIRPALRSRAEIFELKEVSAEDIEVALLKAIADVDDGLGSLDITIEDGALHFLSTRVGGDVRRALNTFEIIALANLDEDNKTCVTVDQLGDAISQRAIEGDVDGDSHYNLLSALQKSIRGSDADAALHYLARILETGDLPIACRRLQVIAFEDISYAEPLVGPFVVSAVTAALNVGLPEAILPLSSAVVYMALSPKSGSANEAYSRVVSDLHQGFDLTIPLHLQDAHYKGAALLGRGVDYKFPHAYPNSVVKQQYLPDSIRNNEYLDIKGNSDVEKRMRATYDILKQLNKD